MGDISANNERFVIIIDKEIKSKFSQIAKNEGRSASNLAAKLIKDYVEQIEGKN